jgi:hypothetical protein
MSYAYCIYGMRTYMQLNFMKFRILVCILNINIYNSSLTLNKYEMWCGDFALGLPSRGGMGFKFHLSQCIFLRILKYSNWLDLL